MCSFTNPHFPRTPMEPYYLEDEPDSSESSQECLEEEGNMFLQGSSNESDDYKDTSSGSSSSSSEGFEGEDSARGWREKLARDPCPCEGSFDDREHCVFFAFLHYRNEEYEQEQCMQDYRVLPINWIATKLTNSDIYHCQAFYWDNPRRTFVSVSVDTYHNGVHEYDKKTFRRGWTFLRLKLPKWQENGIVSFLRAQLGKPMNLLGLYACLAFPISGNGNSYFCSELCLAALQSVGIFLSLSPAGTSPAALFRAIRDSGEVLYSESRHPVVMQSNKAYWEEQKKGFSLEKERRKAERRTQRRTAARLQHDMSSSDGEPSTSDSSSESSDDDNGELRKGKSTKGRRARREEDSLQEQMKL